MHIAWVKYCAQRGSVRSPASIDTLISLIRPELAEIKSCACKHIACMHASLHALVKLYTQRGWACCPDSIDTLISLIQPNLAEIWAHARKHIASMHANLHAWVLLCTPEDRGAQAPLILAPAEGFR